MGREAEFLEQQERREVEVLFLLSSVSCFIYGRFFISFIGLDLGKTAGEGKASYQGKIHQVYSTQPAFIRCLTKVNYLILKM